MYSGDAEIGVTITIHAIGEARNITIYNTGTREVMRIDTDKMKAFTGSGIVAGDEITICTVKREKVNYPSPKRKNNQYSKLPG